MFEVGGRHSLAYPDVALQVQIIFCFISSLQQEKAVVRDVVQGGCCYAWCHIDLILHFSIISVYSILPSQFSSDEADRPSVSPQ